MHRGLDGLEHGLSHDSVALRRIMSVESKGEERQRIVLRLKIPFNVDDVDADVPDQGENGVAVYVLRLFT